MRVWRAGAFGVAARRPARAAAVRPRDAAAALSRADVVAARGVGRRNGDGARAGQRMGAGCMSIRFMSVMVDKGGLKVDDKLVRLVERDIAPGTGVDPEHFWAAFGKLVLEEAPRCAAACLLQTYSAVAAGDAMRVPAVQEPGAAGHARRTAAQDRRLPHPASGEHLRGWTAACCALPLALDVARVAHTPCMLQAPWLSQQRARPRPNMPADQRLGNGRSPFSWTSTRSSWATLATWCLRARPLRSRRAMWTLK